MADDNCRRRTDNASAMAPHFFKVILSSEPRLRLPKKFVKKYGHNLPSLVYLEAPTGPLWQVELARSNGEVWLEKGFQQFKEYYSVGFGYLLVFRYDEDFFFHVLIFDTSATETEYPYAVPKQECEKNMFDASSPLREERQVGADNTVEISEGIPIWQERGRCKGKFANPIDKEVPIKVLADHSTKENAKRQKEGDDVSIEISDCFPPHKTDTEIREFQSIKVNAPSNRTRKVAVNEGQKCATVEDSVNESKKAATLKFALPDHRSKSIGNKSVKLKSAKADTKLECNASTGHHMQLPVLGRIAKERTIAYQRAKAFKSENPFFISFMQPSYVSDRFILCIPKTFTQEYITSKNYCNLVLRVPDGKAWTVKLHVHGNAKICWREFVQHNDLHVRDVCVFERENDTKHPLLNVIIFRTMEDAEGRLYKNMNSVKEDSTGLLDKYSTKQKSKRKGQEVDDDVSIIGNKSVKHKSPKADTKIECNAGTGRHLQLPVLGRIAKERSIAYQRAKAFKSKNPFFISFMQPSYVSDRFVLSIPKMFAEDYITSKNYCDLVLRVPDGKAWTVKLRVHIDAKFCWKEFVQHNDLHVGDVCVFEREKDTKHPLLNVIIFRTIEYAEGCLHRNMNSVKEDSTKVLDDYSTKQKNKRKGQEVADVVSIEILDNFPASKTATEMPEILCSQMKAEIFHYRDKKAAGVWDASPNHQSKSMQCKRVKLERTQANVVPPYFKQKIKRSKRTVTEKAKEKVMAYQKANAFKSNSPLFISFMQPSYVTSTFILTFRRDFAQKYLTNQKDCDVVLGVPDGRTWKVKCSIGNENAKLFWKTFVQDNGLQVGDACVFERKNDAKCSLNVHIFRTIEDTEDCVHRDMSSVN